MKNEKLSFKQTIDNLGDIEFVEFLINEVQIPYANTDKITYTETRDIVKEKYSDGVIYYFVDFHYTLIKKNTIRHIFGKDKTIAETATRTCRDRTPFLSKDDAMFYMENAISPAYAERKSNYTMHKSKVLYRARLFLKQSKMIKKCTDCDTEAIWLENGDIIYGVYGTCKYDTDGLIKCIDNITNQYKTHIPGERSIIASYEMNDLIIMKNDELEKIREQVAESKNARSSIILSEIERSKKYCDFLKTLL